MRLSEVLAEIELVKKQIRDLSVSPTLYKGTSAGSVAYFNDYGSLGIGGDASAYSSLHVLSGKPIILPNLTTTERGALVPSKGMILFNETTNQVNYYNGSTWQAV